MISSIVLSGCGNAGITGGNREELSGGTDKVVSLKAVSYTHLDVYKRQATRREKVYETSF